MTEAILEQGGHPAVRSRLALAAFSLTCGVACLASRWLSAGPVLRVAYGVVVAALLLLVALLSRRRSWTALSSVSFAFFVFAVVQVLNNWVPSYVETSVIHRPPVPGDPLGSTVSATVVVQLLETALAVVPIVVLIRLWGERSSTIYLRAGGASRRGLILAVAVFVLGYLASASGLSYRLFPVREQIPLQQFLAWTPALLVLCVSNGLQEELLFRGLFLQRYQNLLGNLGANLVQATVFANAHAGDSYTPIGFVFLFVVAFPLGLVSGYLMRTTRGLLAPVIFHAGLDIPIYLGFLSYVSSH
jgi:membrane protease YdiL (CAAX protease family)